MSANEIQLIITVKGPNPWSVPGGRFVKGLLARIGDEALEKLAPIHSADKPEDWRAVKVSYEITEGS